MQWQTDPMAQHQSIHPQDPTDTPPNCVRAPVQGVLHAVNQHDPWMATGESIQMLDERSTMDVGVVQKMFQKRTHWVLW